MWWSLLLLGCPKEEEAQDPLPPELETVDPPAPSTPVEACGDGVTNGSEQCDDGPANSDAGACTSACAKATCGDGLLWDGVEACDDGDANADTAACTTACAAAICGDGFVWEGVETCEDGNLVAHDGCSPSCLAPIVAGTGSADVVLSGEEGLAFGYRIAAVGDVNGDGIDDVVVSTPYYDESVGATWVFYGPLAGGDLSVADADARLFGEGPNDYTGTAVAAGDLNGDGIDDLAIGSLWRDLVYVVHGPIAGDIALADVPDRVESRSRAIGVGDPIVVLDADGDGLDDLVLGSPSSGAGDVFVLSGPFEGRVDVATAGAHLSGERPGDAAGTALASAGDTDGDGYGDLIVGAPGHAGGGGAAYVVRGPVIGEIALASTGRLVAEAGSDGLGYAVAGGGDVNGDGLDDVVVGAYAHGVGGAAYVVFGPVSGSRPVADADAILRGTQPGSQAGERVGIVDLDADGVSDVLVGAGDYDRSPEGSDGAIYGLLGPLEGPIDLENADLVWIGAPSDYAGGDALVGGDTNGDGLEDLLVGVRSNDDAGEGAGAAYVWFAPMP